ncbi:FIVAR domain-containing protein [Faecalibaculum rodentium]|uniref:FIVAR domain-containing protein n=1 Tax=Faecalibaculum rodentium TaxID=1702221 RepID=UPI0023F2CBF9|nr:FIVAR domain-containing protein [Faecalibaculum rodentium]
MNKKQLLIRSGNAALAAVLGLSPVTSMIQPLVVQAETVSAGTVTVDNNGNNNIAWLDQLGTAKYFTFSADVTFNDFEEGQQSAALAFGDYRANVHGKIDWAQPVRLWGDGKGVDVRVPGDTGQANTWLADNSISLASTFRLTVSVTEDNVARYSVNGVPAIETPLAADYQGGSFGLMTYSSSATFSNITLDVIPEPDRMALDALLEECAQLQEDDYTPETWAALQTAIAQAKAAASQEEIDAALTAVQEAKAALEKRPEPGEGETDKRELNKLIKQAAALRENDYTAETWTAFSEALTAAQSVAADEKAEQTAVDEALAALQTAMEALEKRTAQEQAPENFNNVGGANAEVVDGTLVLDALGDHFAMLESQKTAANDFHYEADVKLLEGQDGEPDMSAALVFGAASRKTPGSKWYAANMDTRRRNNSDYFRVFGAGQDILGGGNTSDVDPEKPIHLAIDVKSDGSFTYEFGNVGETMHSVSGTIPAWQGGLCRSAYLPRQSRVLQYPVPGSDCVGTG